METLANLFLITSQITGLAPHELGVALILGIFLSGFVFTLIGLSLRHRESPEDWGPLA